MAENIRQWLENLGLGKYGNVFVENEVSLRDLPGITDDDLKELDLPLGPRRRILMEINTLPVPSLDGAVAAETGNDRYGATTAPGAAVLEAERRQLTPEN